MNNPNVNLLKQYHIGSLDHMTHIDNLESILKYGLFAHSNPHKKRDISNMDVNSRHAINKSIFLIVISMSMFLFTLIQEML